MALCDVQQFYIEKFGRAGPDLTWLAVIKSACNFCTRRFMDLSSSSFLCWISSILVL